MERKKKEIYFFQCLFSIYIAYILFFPFSAKILVTTGNPIGNGQKIEIIDLDNFHFKCELMADSLGRGGSVGGLVDNQPIICGGNSNSNEFESGIILGHHNKKVQTIEPNRAYASSVVLDNTALWVSTLC